VAEAMVPEEVVREGEVKLAEAEPPALEVRALV
jgi:hypothetical protein